MRPTYSGVTATLALVVALSGTSYAAVKIDGRDIKDGTITSKDIKNRSIAAKDLEPGLAGRKGPAGPVGPAGPAGPGKTTEVDVDLVGSAQEQYVTVAQLGGLKIEALCWPYVPGEHSFKTAALFASSTSASEVDFSQVQYDADSTDVETRSHVTAAAGQRRSLVASGYQADHGLSQVVWTDSSGVVTGTLRSSYDATDDTCHFAGLIMHS